jgi:hypothetical protein
MTIHYLQLQLDQLEAKKRYEFGERLNFSTGIDGHITYGYGELDEFGFWEFPLRYEFLNSDHKELVDRFYRENEK